MAELDVRARLAASVDTMAGRARQAAADGQAARREAARLWYVRTPAFPLGSLPVVRSSDGGPNGGYFWAVQRITVGPSGAATDLVTVYRGFSVADVVPQNALNTFEFTAAAQFTPWHPGGKGLVLMPDEGLIFAGTITGANPVANMDVVQGELSVLPEFLL